jgi:hypothetical protein
LHTTEPRPCEIKEHDAVYYDPIPRPSGNAAVAERLDEHVGALLKSLHLLGHDRTTAAARLRALRRPLARADARLLDWRLAAAISDAIGDIYLSLLDDDNLAVWAQDGPAALCITAGDAADDLLIALDECPSAGELA